MITFGISTWSIHRSLQSGVIKLIDVPRAVRAHAMSDLQICHFHLASRDDVYLDSVRDSIRASGVTLDALLIDFGDISHADTGPNDAREIEGWLTVAARLGARYARISAGAQMPTEASLARSARQLLTLSEAGQGLGVTVITENWHAMMPGAREVQRLDSLTLGRVPLCIDFGNWAGPSKYGELSAIASRAVTVHAKCAFNAPDSPDEADFQRCLEVVTKSSFAGTIALIYDGPSDDEWRHIDQELAIARSVIG